MVASIGMNKLALSTATQTAGLIDSISRLRDQTREVAPMEMLDQLFASTRTLHVVLGRLSRVIEQQIHPLPFEVPHQRDVYAVIKACKRTIEDLQQQLPELEEQHPGTIVSGSVTLDLGLKADEIRAILYRIDAYTQVMELSLITLSIQGLWELYHSRHQIQVEVRKFTDSVRSSAQIFEPSTPSGQRRLSRESLAGEAQVKNDILVWKKSAEEVVATISLYGAEQVEGAPDASDVSTYAQSRCSTAESQALTVSTEHDEDEDEGEDEDEDEFDAESHRQNLARKQIIQSHFEVNRSNVGRLAACGVFQRAAMFQKKALELREQLSRFHGVDFPPKEQYEMKEMLVNLLTAAKTKESTLEANIILQRLLKEECELPTEQQDPERVSRLYHTMGVMMLNLGKHSQAVTFLSRALEGRKPSDEMVETTTKLAKALQLQKEFDKAEGYLQWLQKDVRPYVQSSAPEVAPNQVLLGYNWSSTLPKVYEWCRLNGFKVETRGFSFDAPDLQLETTPLHKAIQHEETDIVKQMLDYVESWDCGEEVGLPHPILVAASTRNRDTVSALLKKGAKVDVRDNVGMTTLHRCQSKSGGIQVADQLLSQAPDLLDAANNVGKTALFMAAEMGNEKMVLWLLSKGADPNIGQHPHGSVSNKPISTPLIVAIQFVATKSSRKISMIESLLSHGANPRIADIDGKDAFAVAANSGLASSEIKRLLGDYAYPTERAPSMASNHTTNSRSSGSSDSSKRRFAKLKFSRSPE